MRQSNCEDAEMMLFPSFSLNFGVDRAEDTRNARVIVPERIYTTTCLFYLCFKVFDGLSQHFQDVDSLIRTALFTTKNVHPENISYIIFGRFSGNYRHFISAFKDLSEKKIAWATLSRWLTR